MYFAGQRRHRSGSTSRWVQGKVWLLPPPEVLGQSGHVWSRAAQCSFSSKPISGTCIGDYLPPLQKVGESAVSMPYQRVHCKTVMFCIEQLQ